MAGATYAKKRVYLKSTRVNALKSAQTILSANQQISNILAQFENVLACRARMPEDENASWHDTSAS